MMSTQATSTTQSDVSTSEAPSWLLSVPGVRPLIEQIGVSEFRRRLFHMAPAFLVFPLPLIPHPDVWGWILMSTALLYSVAGLLIAVVFAHQLIRPGEQNWMEAVLGYIGPPLSALILFPGRGELALMTLQVIALGDGAAFLAGRLIAGARLPWNRDKTWAGLGGFIVVGTLAATYSYWGEARPAVTIARAALICATATTIAGLAESLPFRSADNFRVGMTTLIVGAILSS